MTAPAVLIYDSDCPICEGGMRWVQHSVVAAAKDQLELAKKA